MFWRATDIDAGLRAKLARVAREGRLDGAPSFVLPLRRAWFARALAFGVAASAALGAGTFALASDPRATIALGVVALLAALASVWTALVVVELVRSRSSAIHPFLLVTPRVLVRADYDHGTLEARRLADAVSFQATEVYTQRQRYKGRRFTFKFADAVVTFVVASREQIDEVERLLASARRKPEADEAPLGRELIPATGGAAKRPSGRAAIDPFGELWIVIAALLMMAALAALVLGSIFGSKH